MARVDIRQYGRIRVVRRPKQSRVAIVSEAAGELLIEYFNEMCGRWTRRVSSVADVRPRDSLQVRHHKSGRDSFPAHVRTKDPNSFPTESEEIVQIAPDHPRRQRAASNGCPAEHWYHARGQ